MEINPKLTHLTQIADQLTSCIGPFANVAALQQQLEAAQKLQQQQAQLLQALQGVNGIQLQSLQTQQKHLEQQVAQLGEQQKQSETQGRSILSNVHSQWPTFKEDLTKNFLSGYDDDAKRREDQSGQVADVAFFVCEFCGHRMETDDRYGCPNCEGEGLDGEDCGAGILPGITGMAG